MFYKMVKGIISHSKITIINVLSDKLFKSEFVDVFIYIRFDFYLNVGYADNLKDFFLFGYYIIALEETWVNIATLNSPLYLRLYFCSHNIIYEIIS